MTHLLPFNPKKKLKRLLLTKMSTIRCLS